MPVFTKEGNGNGEVAAPIARVLPQIHDAREAAVRELERIRNENPAGSLLKIDDKRGLARIVAEAHGVPEECVPWIAKALYWPMWLQRVEEAIEFCRENGLDYSLIPWVANSNQKTLPDAVHYVKKRGLPERFIKEVSFSLGYETVDEALDICKQCGISLSYLRYAAPALQNHGERLEKMIAEWAGTPEEAVQVCIAAAKADEGRLAVARSFCEKHGIPMAAFSCVALTAKTHPIERMEEELKLYDWGYSGKVRVWRPETARQLEDAGMAVERAKARLAKSGRETMPREEFMESCLRKGTSSKMNGLDALVPEKEAMGRAEFEEFANALKAQEEYRKRGRFFNADFRLVPAVPVPHLRDMGSCALAMLPCREEADELARLEVELTGHYDGAIAFAEMKLVEYDARKAIMVTALQSDMHEAYSLPSRFVSRWADWAEELLFFVEEFARSSGAKFVLVPDTDSITRAYQSLNTGTARRLYWHIPEKAGYAHVECPGTMAGVLCEGFWVKEL